MMMSECECEWERGVAGVCRRQRVFHGAVRGIRRPGGGRRLVEQRRMRPQPAGRRASRLLRLQQLRARITEARGARRGAGGRELKPPEE
jgi:hypothetical protein